LNVINLDKAIAQDRWAHHNYNNYAIWKYFYWPLSHQNI